MTDHLNDRGLGQDDRGQVLKCSETTFFTASLSPKDTKISRRQLWVTLKFYSSVARLFLMSEGQNIHCIIGQIVAVQGHVAGVAEGNHQFAQFRHFRERSANVGGRLQSQQLPLDGLAGSPCGVRGLGGQETPASLQTFRCGLGDDYSWQSGIAFSSSVPQVFNQARTSWPVRCRPVS